MPDNSTNFQNRYRVLQEHFHSDLPARLQRILTAGSDWLAAEVPAVADDEFLISVHNLAGSAGSFGFAEISTLCQQLEDNIRDNKPASRAVIRNLLDQLQAFDEYSTG